MVHYDQDFLRRSESESLAEQIISDHMRFVCADGALRMWSERYQVSAGQDDSVQKKGEGVLSILGIRKRIMSLIEGGDALDAFKMCDESRLFDTEVEEEARTKEILSKLVFVDLLKLGRHMEAIRFARTFINEENERDKLFTLIGYRDVSDPRFLETTQFIRRDQIVEILNRHLFKKEVGRELSLLSLALNHYVSILKYQRK